MLRQSLAALLAFTILVAGVQLFGGVAIDPVRSSALEGNQAQRSEDLADMLRRRNAFARFVLRLHGELIRGESSLAGATDRLFYYCLQNYPEFVENIWYVEPGQDLKTKIAHSLLRGFGLDDELSKFGSLREAVMARLERELCELKAEDSAPGLNERITGFVHH